MPGTKKLTPKAHPPSWGDIQRMAASIKRTDPAISSKISGEAFYTLVYLESIVVDDAANKNSPFGD